MLAKFPTGADLQRWATSSNWQMFVAGDYAALAARHSPKLKQLGDIYGMRGLGGAIVRQNLVAVAQVSSTRFQPSDQSFDIAAQLFIGKYGHTCTLYMMMTFFANYMIDYKRTVGTFDIADILSGYRLFEAKWNLAVGKAEDIKPVRSSQKATGQEELKAYLRQAIAEYGAEAYIQEGTRPWNPLENGYDESERPKIGGLIRRGAITPEQVREIARDMPKEATESAMAF